jgi:hypothetical protein
MTLQSIFLEEPLYLAPPLVLIELCLLSWWSRRRTRTAGQSAVAGLIAMPLLLAAQFAIVTENERLREVCHTLASAVEMGDIDTVGSCVSPDFSVSARSGVWDKKAALERMKTGLDRWDIEDAGLSDFVIQADSHRATVEFQAVCRLVSAEVILPRFVSRWRLQFSRENGNWRVTSLRPIPSRWMPYESLDELLGR